MSDRLLQEDERLVLSVERREERHRRQSCGSCSNIHRQPPTQPSSVQEHYLYTIDHPSILVELCATAQLSFIYFKT